MSADGVFRVKELLGEVGRRIGVPAAVETGMIWSRWAEIVGEAVAAHAAPSSLKGGVLRIRTDSSAWAAEIGYLADQIRASANQTVGLELVREVKVWTGPGAVHSAKASPRPTDQKDSREGCDDPRAAVERAHAAWYRRRGRGA